MRVLKWIGSQIFLTKGTFLTVLMMGGAFFVSLPLHAQEFQLNLPNLNLPRPIDEQQNIDELSPVEQNKEDDENNLVQQKILDTNSSSVDAQDVDAKHNEQENIKKNAQSNTQEPIKKNAQENVKESVREYTPALLQNFLQQAPIETDIPEPYNASNQQANDASSQDNGQPTIDTKTAPSPEAAQMPLNENVQVNKNGGENKQEGVNEDTSVAPTQELLQKQVPVNKDIVEPHNAPNQQANEVPSQDNGQLTVDKKTALSPEAAQIPHNENAQEDSQNNNIGDNQVNTIDLLEDPQDVENNPVVKVIDDIVRERDPALKIDAARKDIFRFVSVERKGRTLLYKAAAPSLVTTPEWDGLTMTTIMCKEKNLRPYILDGKAAIQIEMNVVNPAGNYTFLADAHSCQQLTPEGEIPNEIIEEPDVVALALAAEAKRLSLFGCLKNSSTEMLENCTLGMVPRTTWEWQLQDVKAEQRKVIMSYLNKNEAVDDEEIKRVINRTCAKEEIYTIIQLGVVYDITVSGKANKEFLIDKQACDQL